MGRLHGERGPFIAIKAGRATHQPVGGWVLAGLHLLVGMEKVPDFERHLFPDHLRAVRALIYGDAAARANVVHRCSKGGGDPAVSDVIAGDTASGLSHDASSCVADEKSARQQLDSIWLTVPSGPRESCESLAMSGGGQSYVDLLTCLQMAGWVSPASPNATRLVGASKNRNAKK